MHIKKKKIQVLHILTKNSQSSGTISFDVPGNLPTKIYPKNKTQRKCLQVIETYMIKLNN